MDNPGNTLESIALIPETSDYTSINPPSMHEELAALNLIEFPMPSDAKDPTYELVKRIFVAQILLIAIASALFLIAINSDSFGFFWFSFIAGIFGASVALLRRVQQGGTEFAQATLHSWATTLMPLLYGGVMAGVTYFLFTSQILSGQEGRGLLATNLFPDFAPLEGAGDSVTAGQTIPVGESKEDVRPVSVEDWRTLRPLGMPSAGKLMVWCFLAGYSESFVAGILKRLQHSASTADVPPKSEST